MKLIQKHRSFKGEQCFYEHESLSLKKNIKIALYQPVAALNNKPHHTLLFLGEAGHAVETIALQSAYQNFANRYDVQVLIPDWSAHSLDTEEDFNLFTLFLHQELPLVLHQNQSAWGIMGHGAGADLALRLIHHAPQHYRSVSLFAPSFHQAISASAFKIPLWLDQIDSVDEAWRNAAALLKNAYQNKEHLYHLHFRKRYRNDYFFIQSFMREHFVFHSEYV